MRIAIIYGTAAAPGRLARAQDAFRSIVEAEGVATETIDLHGTVLEGADGRAAGDHSAAVRGAIDVLSRAEAVVVFTPIYRAAAPGVLKNLLDLAPLEALENKPVAVVSMGGSDHHYLAADADLAPVLTWFGAITVPFRLYLRSSSFANGEPTAAAAAEIAAYARSVVDFARRMGGVEIRPRPLSAPRP
jgi:FMN reductase